MGLILLPLVYLDSNILIHAFEGDAVISSSLLNLFKLLEVERVRQ